jgi:hypothetical protein
VQEEEGNAGHAAEVAPMSPQEALATMSAMGGSDVEQLITTDNPVFASETSWDLPANRGFFLDCIQEEATADLVGHSGRFSADVEHRLSLGDPAFDSLQDS